MCGFNIVFYANAGVPGAKDQKTKMLKLIGDIEVEEFMRALRVNTLRYKDPFSNSELSNPLTFPLGSAFLAVKHASKAMVLSHPDKPAPGGSIIATASVAGVRSGSAGCMSPHILAPLLSLELHLHPPTLQIEYTGNHITLYG